MKTQLRKTARERARYTEEYKQEAKLVTILLAGVIGTKTLDD